MSDIVPAQEFGKYTAADITAARDIICKDAPDHIIRLILYRCSQLGADPYSKMVYAVQRGGTWTLQVSIDMFRATAESAGDYAGQDGPFWCGKDGIWKDVWLEKEHPQAAKVGVFRKGFAQALYSVANWDSYASSAGQMWSKFGPLMIGKCAEALALRRAFPAKLSGLYTSDEMHQADAKPVVLQAVEKPVVALQPASVLIQATDGIKQLGQKLGKLQGAVNADLQRVGGDIGALMGEYQNALLEKNPRGTPDRAVAVPAESARTTQQINEPAVDGEAGTHMATLIPVVTQKLAATQYLEARQDQDKTRHVMAIMQAFTHPALIAKYGAFSEQMKLMSHVANREITAYSDLNLSEAQFAAIHLQEQIPASTPATEEQVKHLQIVMKDAKIVEWLKSSKAYKTTEDGGGSQSDCLKSARLAFASHILGTMVTSFKELTADEAAKLSDAAKKQASK